MDSILTSVKKLLGLPEAETAFDVDITMHINSVFSILRQMGVGPSTGYAITDKTDAWDDFIPDADANYIEMVKSYVYLKVRQLFDPPTGGAVANSSEKLIAELEWRLYFFKNVEVEGTT